MIAIRKCNCSTFILQNVYDSLNYCQAVICPNIKTIQSRFWRMGDFEHRSPRIEACKTPLSFGKLLPAKNAAPPSENWTMTGRLSSLPASKTAFTVLVVVQLYAGMAKPFSLACLRRFHARSPVITPAWKDQATKGGPQHEFKLILKRTLSAYSPTLRWSGVSGLRSSISTLNCRF